MYKWLSRAALVTPLSLGIAVLLLYASYSTGLHFGSVEIGMPSAYTLKLDSDVRMFWASILAPSSLGYRLLGSAVNPGLGDYLQRIYTSIPSDWGIVSLAISFFVGFLAGFLSKDIRAALVSSLGSVILAALIGASLSISVLTSQQVLSEAGIGASVLTSLAYALASLQCISGVVLALVATFGGVLATKLLGAQPVGPSQAPTTVVVQATEREAEKPLEVGVKVEKVSPEEALAPEVSAGAAQPAVVEEVTAPSEEKAITPSGEVVPGAAELAAEALPHALEEEVSIMTPEKAEAFEEHAAEAAQPAVFEEGAMAPTEAVEERATEGQVEEKAAAEAELERERSLEERLREIEELLARFEEAKVTEPEVEEAISEIPVIPVQEKAELPERVLEELMKEEARPAEAVEERATGEQTTLTREPLEIPEEETKYWDAWNEAPASGPLKAKVPCPLCGNALTWDEGSARYYCRKCDVFL
jgi:hypothetical protein